MGYAVSLETICRAYEARWHLSPDAKNTNE
jgi:hypothetical protein